MNKSLFYSLLGLAGAVILGIPLMNRFGGDSTPKSQVAIATPVSQPTAVITPLEWTTYSDNDLHFSFQSPIKLEVNKPPAGLYAKTVDMEGHSMGGDLYLRVQAVEVTYDLDLSQEMEKQVNTLKSMGEALRNLQTTTKPMTIGDASGFLAEGSAHLPGRTPWEMKLLKVKRGTTVLDMFIQYSPTGAEIDSANKILQSLSFSN